MPVQLTRGFKGAKKALAALVLLAALLTHSCSPVTYVIPNVPENDDFFSVVVLPDTQYYAETYPHIFLDQAQWITEKVDQLNIAFVSHSGDMVNEPGDIAQWQFADIAMSELDGEVPYGVLPGNHDQPTGLYNEYFGYERYQDELWYGGHYGEDNDNNYQLFSANGIDFIIIHLQYNPTAAIVGWADDLLTTYSDRVAVINTHSALDKDSTLTDGGDTLYGLMRDNSNLKLVLCGHKHGEALKVEMFADHTTHIMLANYQKLQKGGRGYLRILTFMPDRDQVAVNTYSPWLDEYRTGADSRFVLNCEI